MIEFDFPLTSDEMQQLDALPPEAWFTGVKFQNAESPQLPALKRLEGAHQRKHALVRGWLERVVPGRTVLDTFCANGAFSFYCEAAGAASITGVEWDTGRVDAARLIASFLRARRPGAPLTFQTADAYALATTFPKRFDVSLCLGGLYHVADPAHVLRQLRAVTGEYLVVQTSNVLRGRRNHAQFRVRRDQTAKGLSSIVGGAGKWDMTVPCFRELLRHGGFEIVEDRRSLPMYAALCRAV